LQHQTSIWKLQQLLTSAASDHLQVQPRGTKHLTQLLASQHCHKRPF
jgi:hypothetical protein